MTLSLTCSPDYGNVGTSITFTASAGHALYCIEFGDGQLSYSSSASHSYTAAGEYLATVTASDSNGHNVETASLSVIILESGQSIVGFRVKKAWGTAPFTVQFINTSPETIDSYLWDFGDGETSTDRNPEHTYTNPQDYTVKLSVTEGSTTRTIIESECIHVASSDPPVAGFIHTLTDNSGSIPVSVEFTDTSTGTITEGEWQFGDGGTSTDENPTHVYSKAGYYFVRRIVRNDEYEDEYTELFYIRPRAPTIRIHADAETGMAPLTVIFTPVIIGAYIRFEWDFGDDTTSIELNPEHTYETPGTYTVTLTVWNTTTQHSTSATKTITVQDPALFPSAVFSADVTEGETPLEVTFTNSSTLATSYLWDFGDGETSTTAEPVHTYDTPGVYTVSLTAINNLGSDIETKTGYITVGTDPVADLSVDADIHRLSHEFEFSDESLYGPTSWLWDFGDSESSTDQNPKHTYDVAQSYWVTLTVTNAYGSTSKGIDVTVVPDNYPLPSFTSFTTQRKAPFTMKFTNTSTLATSYLWDFGDGETSTETDPTHIYQFPGRYIVSLTASNSYGTVTITEEVLNAD